MYAAVGILTTRGGMTSHAAVVARGMGKPCITAAMSLKIALENQSCNCMGKELHAGDTVTIDGASGLVFEGVQEIVVPEPDGELAILMGVERGVGRLSSAQTLFIHPTFRFIQRSFQTIKQGVQFFFRDNHGRADGHGVADGS